jgi:aminoglycoside 6'-N-acetyltransferase I
MTDSVTVALAVESDRSDVSLLRVALWPDSGEDAYPLEPDGDEVYLIARIANGVAAGFAELSLRHDYVSGCDTSPVGFLEGIYVVPEQRRLGIARQIVATAEQWARSRGCTEFGSDALLDNLASHRMHAALGFAEVSRVVSFRKALD